MADEESSWLLRTASALQMQGLEERGQGWMVKRESSTSLVRGGDADDGSYNVKDEWVETGGMRSTGRSRVDSRYTSRYTSRLPSHLGSRAQSRAGSAVDLSRRDGLRALTRINRVGEDGGVEGPDFVDPKVFEEEEEEAGSEGEEEVDEGEMRRVVMGRARGWVDWAVGWMDSRGEEEWEEGDGDGERDGEGRGDGEGRRRRRRGGEAHGVEERQEVGQRAVAGPAPPGEGKGVVADAKWLLGVASRIIV